MPKENRCQERIDAWQAQYLLSLEVDFACSAHWK